MTSTVLDTFLSDVQLDLRISPVQVQENELVHVMGTTEPVRHHPDERARSLLKAGLLSVESVKATLAADERLKLIKAIQDKAHTWLEKPPTDADAAMLKQVRWLFSKSRFQESPQQIIQRVWLTVVLYNLGMRGLHYTDEGQILWEGGGTERIGVGPDRHMDAAIERGEHTIYVTSFRRPDGTIVRGKGRQRWYVYRVTIDPRAELLFERRKAIVRENIALIVASETRATQPQLPRDFYGSFEFQQACIDAQEQQFHHALVLSPAHGVISLDEIVPADTDWEEVVDGQFWRWQTLVVQKLGAYLFGTDRQKVNAPDDFNWWLWLNPESVYSFTVFGGGLAVRMLFDYLLRTRAYSADQWPHIILSERRSGYGADDFEEDLDLDLGMMLGDEGYLQDERLLDAILPDLDQMMEWAATLSERVTVYVEPLGQTWQINADEALIPVRIMHEANVEMGTVLSTLQEISFVLDHNTPFSVLFNTGPLVATLLQFTHNLVHRDHNTASEVLKLISNPAIRHYLETVMQDQDIEDRLCGVLVLAEQLQMLALMIPQSTQDMLSVWMHTYIAARATR